MIEILKEQPNENNPVIVDNYPYGYTLRTQIKYWVETTKNGQRFISQTLNPKTKLWNKPKKSTYSQIILVGLNEEKHITYTSLSLYSLSESLEFKQKYESFLSDYQKTELTNIIKMSEVYDKVEYSFKAQKFRHILTGEITECVPLFDLNNYEQVNDNGDVITPEDPDKKERERKEINRQINKTAILNASTQTNIDSALNTFKRAR